MTLEQLVTYLWHDMPLTSWASILASLSTLGGVAIYLEGKGLMRSRYTTSLVEGADGKVVATVSCSVGSGLTYGRNIARSGLLIALSSLGALISVTYL